ncbi:hypothetical protein [Aurantimonas endophytica]|uniref:Uncharacterized protein n=1 Tax=Aurantimonas endophytica TaxID=1522175 RepID=A0A7W6MMZ8_9HYPH|nr:hypothetical protein [Aurantimonas endophytica]MBB4001385.1 hypothetical protein [Aurantimonas endophytica]MCO6402972.1 hypothetical protein [Aurantimonas endophytica]
MTETVRQPFNADEEQVIARDFAPLSARHAAWLGARGLTDRPWFILGSAPDPHVPDPFPPRTAHVHVKYAGHAARQHGLPSGDLTFLLTKTKPEEIAGLSVDSILRLCKRQSLLTRLRRDLPFLKARECALTDRERDAFIIGTLGTLFGGSGDEIRPSNGVALIAYAIAVGIPQIIVAGISLDSDGYAYDRSARTRRHLAEDRAALAVVAERYPQVTTTEPSLSRITGLPLMASVAAG